MGKWDPISREAWRGIEDVPAPWPLPLARAYALALYSMRAHGVPCATWEELSAMSGHSAQYFRQYVRRREALSQREAFLSQREANLSHSPSKKKPTKDKTDQALKHSCHNVKHSCHSVKRDASKTTDSIPVSEGIEEKRREEFSSLYIYREEERADQATPSRAQLVRAIAAATSIEELETLIGRKFETNDIKQAKWMALEGS